jgi:hypothetical protein
MHIVTKRETGGQSCVRGNVLFVLAKRYSICGSDRITAAAVMTPDRGCGIRGSVCVGSGY